MPTIINADTVVGGAIITADSSGVLNLQTVGTTAVSISTGQVVTFTNTPLISGGGDIVTTTATQTLTNKTLTSPTMTTPVLGVASATSISTGLGAVGTPPYTFTGDTDTGMWSPAANTVAISTNGAEVGRFTSAGYLEAVYSDKVSAIGNTGTAATINLALGTVFTATLTGNCTFTLSGSNANSNRGSSFTLILTNDGTAGRTVAWAGGSFRFPGGAASLSRTTTANAVDIWVFFTPDNGTTWYGNIAMKNMTA